MSGLKVLGIAFKSDGNHTWIKDVTLNWQWNLIANIIQSLESQCTSWVYGIIIFTYVFSFNHLVNVALFSFYMFYSSPILVCDFIQGHRVIYCVRIRACLLFNFCFVLFFETRFLYHLVLAASYIFSFVFRQGRTPPLLVRWCVMLKELCPLFSPSSSISPSKCMSCFYIAGGWTPQPSSYMTLCHWTISIFKCTVLWH